MSIANLFSRLLFYSFEGRVTSGDRHQGRMTNVTKDMV
jgi:hypothetical protein